MDSCSHEPSEASETMRYLAAVDDFRDDEYPMLQDSIYLDHAGSTLCAKSLMDAFAREITTVLYGNPHSASEPSQRSTSRIDDIRVRLLSFLRADPRYFDLVFVANATAGIKLVVDGLRGFPGGYSYAYHEACHTSAVGARQEAVQSVCLDDDAVQAWIDGSGPFSSANQEISATLFSYSAQSHMDGTRYPLDWSSSLRAAQNGERPDFFTLLDASSLCATSQLDLCDPDSAPDFTVLSLYKIFGFPDLGVLLVRRSAEHAFSSRKYFGGGTVDMVTCHDQQWHSPKSHFLHERLEDGTLPFHNIIAAGIAMDIHKQLFGSMSRVSSHTAFLRARLEDGLAKLQHGNGRNACVLYSSARRNNPNKELGPVVAFNLKDSSGAWVSLAEFEKLAVMKKIHVRTGGLCAPGGIASALQLEPWEMKKNFSAGYRCGTDDDILFGKPTGVIRASLGSMSTQSDVAGFLSFIREFFVQETPSVIPACPRNAKGIARPVDARVKAINIYPIKSCGTMSIPPMSRWKLRPEGLAWDREWCLVHTGSGQALSQKRYPRMALLKPFLDLENGVLRIEYRGQCSTALPDQLTVPLSSDPEQYESHGLGTSSRVCGDAISALKYVSERINSFFTQALGVPCILARFPPGGVGIRSRLTKAEMPQYQRLIKSKRLPGAFPDVPSPPESDTEPETKLCAPRQPGKILLSNESPILMIHASSVRALNDTIEKGGGVRVSEDAFRANIIIESQGAAEDETPFVEDTWRGVHIGHHNFQLLGACRRCQMVCVDQDTGQKKQEPFTALSKTRRFDGKVYFGQHMRHQPPVGHDCNDCQHPTIQVGDVVSVDV